MAHCLIIKGKSIARRTFVFDRKPVIKTFSGLNHNVIELNKIHEH